MAEQDHRTAEPAATHECVFTEEQEPSGRLVLPPCLVCGTTAMDALQQLHSEVHQLRPATLREAADIVQAEHDAEAARLTTAEHPEPHRVPLLSNWLGGIQAGATALRDHANRQENER